MRRGSGGRRGRAGAAWASGWGLTGRGWTLVGAGAGCGVAAYLTGIDSLLVVAVFVLAAVGVALGVARGRRPSGEVRRTVTPAVLVAGMPATVRLELRVASGRHIVGATGQDRWTVRLPGARPDDADYRYSELTALAAGPRDRAGQAGYALGYGVVPASRGEVVLGPFLVKVADPFGLAWGLAAVGAETAALVLPAMTPLPAGGVLPSDTWSDVRQPSRPRAGEEHEASTRDYRVGDPLRRIHWRASAHHGELMVRQEEDRHSAEATMVLDTHREGYPDAGRERQVGAPESALFEWAVAFAASVASHLTTAGLSVRLLETALPAPVADATAFGGHHGEHGLLMTAATAVAERLADRALQGDAAVRGWAETPRGGTVVAVVATPGTETMEALRQLRASFGTALIFVAQDAVSPDTRDAVEAAKVSDAAASAPDPATAVAGALYREGWRVVLVPPGATVGEAWTAPPWAPDARPAARGGQR